MKIEKLRKKINVVLTMSIILGIMLAVTWAISQSRYIDYNPINGDFQNYNPVRRLLAGEIPFKDFSIYLGCGQMYLEALILSIIGNTFKNSLFSMYFLSVLCFLVSVAVMGYIVSGKKTTSILVADMLVLVNICRPEIFRNNMISDLWVGFNIGLVPGNSARLIRGFVIVVSAIILITIAKYVYIHTMNISILTCIVALQSGILLVWSNDYGVASTVSISLIYALIVSKIYWKKWSKIFNQASIYMLSYAVGVLLTVSVITRMNFYSWLKFMLGVGKYQQWYYGTQIGHKTYHLYELDYSFWSILSLIIGVIYMVKLLKTKCEVKNINYIAKCGVLSYMFFSAFLGTNMYRLISGGIAEEMLQVILIGYGISILINILGKLNLNRKYLTAIVSMLSVSYCISTGCQYILTNTVSEGYQYMGKRLNGNLNNMQAESIKLATEKLEEKEVFSTYASAVEVCSDLFQPTGYDYIIHVLGDDTRVQYMKDFTNQSCEYVSTIRKDYSVYEYWVRNANWFFYRKLYSEYTPSFATGYQIFWEKGDARTYDILPEVEIEQISDSKIKIMLRYSDEINAVADVGVSYATEYMKAFYKTGAIKKMVYVDSVSQKSLVNVEQQDYVNFFIPEESDMYYIPITVVKGYGEAVLEGVPINQVKLNFKNITIENTIFEPTDFIKVCDFTDENWLNGINRYDNVLLFENTELNWDMLKDAKYLRTYKGNKYEVESVNEVDNFYIHVVLKDGSADIDFTYPNSVIVLK